MAVGLIDSLVDWLQREKKEEQREWLRIVEFLLGAPQQIESPYGIPYATSIGPIINNLIDFQLVNSSYPKHFLVWLEKWNTEQTWKGFVYPQIDSELQRQQQVDSDAAYSVKYYWEGPHPISLVDTPQINARQETVESLHASETDPRNWSTHGRKAPYSDPEYNIVVKISHLKVRFTSPLPALTPFDFILVKCRHLVSEIVTFISQYDAVVDGMDVREEIMADVQVYWLQGHKFPAPLNSPQIHFCLKSIFLAIDALKTHAGWENDFDKKDRADQFNLGYYRRLEILRQLASPRREFAGKRLFYEVGLQLGLIAERRSSSISEDLTYLRKLALSIDDDVVRAFKDCRKSPVSLEYNYQGKREAGAVAPR
jgi:hypothetical protein